MKAFVQVPRFAHRPLASVPFSSPKAAPSSRASACPIAPSYSRFSESIVRRSEVRRDLLRNRQGDCQGANSAFQFAILRTMAGELSLGFRHRARDDMGVR
jgi:hypothetical protein